MAMVSQTTFVKKHPQPHRTTKYHRIVGSWAVLVIGTAAWVWIYSLCYSKGVWLKWAHLVLLYARTTGAILFLLILCQRNTWTYGISLPYLAHCLLPCSHQFLWIWHGCAWKMSRLMVFYMENGEYLNHLCCYKTVLQMSFEKTCFSFPRVSNENALVCSDYFVWSLVLFTTALSYTERVMCPVRVLCCLREQTRALKEEWRALYNLSGRLQ